MHARFLAREEEEPVRTFAENRRAHEPMLPRSTVSPAKVYARQTPRLCNLSLSRARPPRASIRDTWRPAKSEGLQARANVRPRVGCSEKLAGHSPRYNPIVENDRRNTPCICDVFERIRIQQREIRDLPLPYTAEIARATEIPRRIYRGSTDGVER